MVDPNVITSLKETSVFIVWDLLNRLPPFKLVILTAGTEPVFADVLADGTWQILLTGLSEGRNQIALVSVDFFGNESLETITSIDVDLTPPDIK